MQIRLGRKRRLRRNQSILVNVLVAVSLVSLTVAGGVWSVVHSLGTTQFGTGTFTAVDNGSGYGCGISSGKAYCWGANGNGQLGDASTTQRNTPVAVTTAAGILAGKTVTAISAGTSHTCAVANGLAYCWGLNTNGRVGDSSTTQRTAPVAVTAAAGILSGKTVSTISAGATHSCAVANNLAYCWGLNANGQLGDNSLTQRTAPVAVNTATALSAKSMTGIAAGSGYTCAVGSGAAYCWGLNDLGQLGNASNAQSQIPVAVSTSGVLGGKTVTGVDTGSSAKHVCVVASAQAYCWGQNSNGQLGANWNSDSNIPITVTPWYYLSGKTVTMVSADMTNSCAVTSGQIYCWGLGTNGQLGDDITNRWAVPAETNMGGMEENGVTALSGGNNHTCGISAGAAYCWGANGEGRLGNNTTIDTMVPTAVSATGVLSGKTVTAIAAGSNYSCAVASGAAYCWGNNANGRLGDGTTTQRPVPVAVDTTGVLAGKTVTQVATGTNHACVIASGAVYCWGLNNYGQLGDGLGANSLRPVAVNTSILGGKTVTDITASLNFTCVVASGAAYCWGDNSNGQLGTNAVLSSSEPEAVYTGGVLNGKTVTAVASGGFHACAIANSAAYCWGLNTSGQLGDNTTTQRLEPVAVYTGGLMGGKTVTKLAGGNLFTCAIASGATYCWGVGGNGALGDSSLPNSSIPIEVDRFDAQSGDTVVTLLATGYAHACGGIPLFMSCWGLNVAGQLATTKNYSGNPTPLRTSNSPLSTDSYRFYTDSASLTPGTPLANTNTPAQLTSIAQTFRMRFGVKTMAAEPILPVDNSFKLQFAQKTAASCSAQSSGFADITRSTLIAYAANASVDNRKLISSTGNDPFANSVPE